jgi:hypothetical protein
VRSTYELDKLLKLVALKRYGALGWLEARHLDLIPPVWIALTETGK